MLSSSACILVLCNESNLSMDSQTPLQAFTHHSAQSKHGVSAAMRHFRFIKFSGMDTQCKISV